MPSVKPLISELKRRLCCPPPPAPTGLTAAPGGGSMEVLLTWDPPAATQRVRSFRVYRQRGEGRWWLLAVVANDPVNHLAPGRLGVVDAPDYWPWPAGADTSAERCYRVAAVSEHGLEGPMSSAACAVGS